jgi:hypothetical protein
MAETKNIKFEVAPNASCIFCHSQPTTTVKVWLGSKTPGKSTTLPQAPCCAKCREKYKKFNMYWLIATFVSGLIISFSIGFMDPSFAGDPRENFIGFIALGIFLCILPVGLIYALALELVYSRRARKWLKEYTTYYS